ncbi:guanylate cyclase 32E-like isoform X2 [Neocloeon triangulifer]|uniref:guanylate cyclase 32E-like isoform X2 n=1 Tax=Neocloeon triangulifer TaxID=2078957 RepID=UPI00286F2F59|nr:guanylate cyclase 32E-like isoform X2 [Neocloeon triangulifer]
MRLRVLLSWLVAMVSAVHVMQGADAGHGKDKQIFTLGYITGSRRRPWDKEYPRPGLQISGAISLALAELNASPTQGVDQGGLLARRGIHLQLRVAETYGEEQTSILRTAALWSQNVTAFIGPQESCLHEARMAAAFNLPMISYYCTDHQTSDKRLFATFARTRPPDTHISKSVVAVLKAFNWTTVSVLHLATDDTQFSRIADTLEAEFRMAAIKVSSRLSWNTPYHHGYSDNPFHQMVLDTYKDARIYVIVGYHYESLGLLIALQDLGLFKEGEYFVLGVDIEHYDNDRPEKYTRGLLNEEQDPKIDKAFRNFIGVVASSPASQLTDNFTQLVNHYMEKPPFSFPNPLTYLGGVKKLRPEAAYLYDAVQLYAKALCDVLDGGGDPRNGTAIIESIKGRTYVSAMGYVGRMDENGDAEGNYTLLTTRPHHKTPGDFGLYPAGTFLLSGGGWPDLHLTSEIDWPLGKPPLAEPECGFRGEKCISHTPEILSGLIGGAAIAVIVIGLILYRNWRYEQELDSLLWKLDYNQIQMAEESDKGNNNGSLTPNGNGSLCPKSKSQQNVHPLVRTSQVSLSSNPEADFRYSALYTPVGLYKGRMFAIKKINRRQVDITRNLKKELKMLRDLRHDNLNAFIGACTDPPHICIVTEYCARGSLKDIIENEDLKLDNMFVASLVGDIVRGMTFLHDSPVKSHGNLKSANCLVDSRWVLKISDFGLHELKQDPAIPSWTRCRDVDGRWIGQDLTYRAPELIRLMARRASGHHSLWLDGELDEGPGVALVAATKPWKQPLCNPEEDEICVRGTQKGDVYSFAIIFYEMHARHGAYDALGLSMHDIISRIVAQKSIPFRPPIDALEGSFDFVRELIRDCWVESPEQRPEFKSLRARLRPMRKGMKPNIFDNMMAMMEKYANNLEVLVDERTDQLVEEKKKTEALLFEMLPRSVAEQLRKGHKVQAESYDAVTIYFSDIVGFTSMSAESTPLQVVDFLNDLYTCFDSIIENYDVYKVETIGDAYMVVSGLPIRNKNAHAGEIASMSLHLLAAVRKFSIRHRPGDTLKLRIGIHSGPVCAGVVGLKMPRYCLFGDTVNTASRMESTGSELRIHCSAECRALLEKLGGYELLERGVVPMKGKGDRLTYWLVSEDPIFAAERRRLRKERFQNSLAPHHANGSALSDIPRSSLKKSRSPVMRNHQLARASSLESPKRLRFALGSLERCSEGERVCDAGRNSHAIIPAIRLPPDQISPGNPRRMNSVSPASTISAPSSASCPCIEALRLSPERQPLCWAPSPYSSLAASSVPLLLGCLPPQLLPPGVEERVSDHPSDQNEPRQGVLLSLTAPREPKAPPSRV